MLDPTLHPVANSMANVPYHGRSIYRQKSHGGFLLSFDSGTFLIRRSATVSIRRPIENDGTPGLKISLYFAHFLVTWKNTLLDIRTCENVFDRSINDRFCCNFMQFENVKSTTDYTWISYRSFFVMDNINPPCAGNWFADHNE